MDQNTRGNPPLASKPLQRFVLLRTLTKLLFCMVPPLQFPLQIELS